MKYTQTTTTPISEENNKKRQIPIISINAVNFFFFICLLTLLVAGLIWFFLEREKYQMNELQKYFNEQQQTQGQIRAIEEQNKAKATEVRNESQKDREQAKIIRDNAFVPMHEFKPSSHDTMIKYLKEARP